MAYTGGVRLVGSRQHLYSFGRWAHLDAGERKLRELFPLALIHTTLSEDNKTAILSLWGDEATKEVFTFEEAIEDFPSDHLIAQMMLVTG